jgi:hypothetical protein
MRTPADVFSSRLRPTMAAWPAWWPLLLAIALTAPLTAYWWGLVAAGSVAFDWRIFVEAGVRFHVGSPDLYEVTELYSFRHSPILAMLMPAVAWIGVTGIRLVTLACALALPTWPMRLLAVASWPLAMDVQHGALITLILLAAAWALNGSRVAALGFIVLALLSPRPLMIPIAAYLLWQQQWLRLPSVGLFVAHALAVVASGYSDEWMHILLSVSTDMLQSPFNLSPSRFIGGLWVPIGVALAAVLIWRGRPGLGALAISPYLLPHYLLLGLLELGPRARAPERDHHSSPAPTTG